MRKFIMLSSVILAMGLICGALARRKDHKIKSTAAS
jgi:hypothetical protein